MDYSLLMHPIVGAVIGYITNWIAVKMLFRPSKAIYIGKFRLPFTPGIIPKNQSRLAHGISNTISGSLLNEDQINEYIDTFLNSDETEDISLNDLINQTEYSDKLNTTISNLIETISNSILTTIKEANLAEALSIQIENAIKENMQKNVLTKLIKKPVMDGLSANLEPKINEYIDANGKDLIKGMVEKELTKYLNTSNMDVKDFIKQSNIDIKGIIISLYSSIISNKLSSILETINISKVIENEINSFEPKKMEELVIL